MISSCIGLVVYKEKMDALECSSLIQAKNAFGSRHPFVLAVRDDVKSVKAYTDILGDCEVKSVKRAMLSSVGAYNAYCLTPDFYDIFAGYEYVVLIQLDGWVFYDAVDWWVSRGYDYIAAPWFFGGRYTFNHTQGRRIGGNGGMSIRNVAACRGFADDVVKHHPELRKAWEDRVFSRGGRASHYTGIRQLRYPEYCDQARFCWNNANISGYGNEYALLRAMTGAEIPMCLHKPSASVRSKLCIVDRDPSHIFLFRDTHTVTDRTARLINDVCPSRDARLLVAINECKPVTVNDAGFRLFSGEHRFLTLHFQTESDWVGPYSHFSSFGEFIGSPSKGYRGRHDALCVEWSDDSTRRAVTYDGEIPDICWSQALSAVQRSGSDIDIACDLLRKRYPNAALYIL